MIPVPQSGTLSIAHILGMEDVVRVQDPDLMQTEGADPRWFIRVYVDAFDGNGARCKRRERVYLGRVAEVKKRDAITRKNEVLARINKSQIVLQAQIRFGALLDHYLTEFVRRPEQLASTTRAKYEIHIANHIRPAWAETPLCDINGLAIERWLNAKAQPRIVEKGGEQKIAPGLSWATRTDLRNLMSGIFSKAIDWQLWKCDNPVARVKVGKRRDVRPHVKLTVEQTRMLLAELPPMVRAICETGLYCTLRISEVLGLQWKHIDFTTGLIRVRQRYSRGDLDTVKTEKARREVPMGELAVTFAAFCPRPMDPEGFVFTVPTYVDRRKRPGGCRDDRDINQHFLRPAARRLGLYVPGFGFHAFRREAVTELGATMNPHQIQRMAGHANADMSLHYTLADLQAQEAAVRHLQERIRGKVVEIKKGA